MPRKVLIVVIALALTLPLLVVGLALTTHIEKVSYEREVPVGLEQRISVSLRGFPCPTKIVVWTPSGITVEHRSEYVKFVAREEGRYGFCVYVYRVLYWSKEGCFYFTAYDKPHLKLHVPSEILWGEELRLIVEAQDSSGIASIRVRVNGTPVTLERTGNVWTAALKPERVGKLLVEAVATDPYGNTAVSKAVVRVVIPDALGRLARELNKAERDVLFELYSRNPELVLDAIREKTQLIETAIEAVKRKLLDVDSALALINGSVLKVAFLLELDTWTSEAEEPVTEYVNLLSSTGLPFSVAFYPAINQRGSRGLEHVLQPAGSVVCYTYSHSSLLRLPKRLVRAEIDASLAKLRSIGVRLAERVLVLPWGEYGPHVLDETALNGWLVISLGARTPRAYAYGKGLLLLAPYSPPAACVADACVVSVRASQLVNTTLNAMLRGLIKDIARGNLSGRRVVAAPLEVVADLLRLNAEHTPPPLQVERLTLPSNAEENWLRYSKMLSDTAAMLEAVENATAWEERVCSAVATWVFWVEDPSSPSPTALQEEALRRLGLTVHDLRVETLWVRRWVYQLQNANLSELESLPVDLLVIDPDDSGFTQEDLERLKSTGKIVLAYIDIGEAEDYRDYWDTSWYSNPPPWLGEENPDWPGCYFVKYWYREWQDIVFKRLKRIVELGYDGVYLDGIDVYEYWEEKGYGKAREYMIELVVNISRYVKSIKREFLVFPQNGLELLRDKRYLSAIDGVGKEDTWFLGDEKRSESEVEHDLALLREARQAGKLVLVIDYPTDLTNIRVFFAQALAEGFVPYVGPLELDRVGYYVAPPCPQCGLPLITPP